MILPEWMQNRISPDVPAPARRGGGFLRKALGALAGLLAEMLANERIARRPGLLQGVDARAKVIGLVGLVVVTTLVSDLATLALAYAACLLLAALSRVPARRLLRVWIVIPLFSAAIMLPAMLNIVTPGKPLLTLWHFTGWDLTVTDSGLYVAARFTLRVVVCVTLALLLTATTRTNRLFRGLRALGVPVLFVMLLGMMERYLALFIRAAEEIHLARLSRSAAQGPLRQEQAWVAAGIGSLFRRTQKMGDAVHLAMISRGYTGDIHLLGEPRWKLADWGFLLMAAGLAVAMMAWKN